MGFLSGTLADAQNSLALAKSAFLLSLSHSPCFLTPTLWDYFPNKILEPHLVLQ